MGLRASPDLLFTISALFLGISSSFLASHILCQRCSHSCLYFVFLRPRHHATRSQCWTNIAECLMPSRTPRPPPNGHSPYCIHHSVEATWFLLLRSMLQHYFGSVSLPCVSSDAPGQNTLMSRISLVSMTAPPLIKVISNSCVHHHSLLTGLPRLFSSPLHSLFSVLPEPSSEPPLWWFNIVLLEADPILAVTPVDTENSLEVEKLNLRQVHRF